MEKFIFKHLLNIIQIYFLRVIFIAFLFSFSTAFAQTKEELRLAERKNISRAFLLNRQMEKIKDTNQIILFAVKVKVDNTKDKIVVKDISVSDSTHVYIYKNFDFLKTVNYNVFTDRRAKDLNFVFPISISVVNVKKKPDPYLPSINFSKNILNYLFFKDYDNDPIADYIFIPGINTVFFQEEQL